MTLTDVAWRVGSAVISCLLELRNCIKTSKERVKDFVTLHKHCYFWKRSSWLLNRLFTNKVVASLKTHLKTSTVSKIFRHVMRQCISYATKKCVRPRSGSNSVTSLMDKPYMDYSITRSKRRHDVKKLFFKHWIRHKCWNWSWTFICIHVVQKTFKLKTRKFIFGWMNLNHLNGEMS